MSSGPYCYSTNSDYGDQSAGACAWASLVGVYARADVIAGLTGQSWAPADNRLFTVVDPGVASAEACQDLARNWPYDATDDCEGWTFDDEQSCYLKGALACTPIFGTVVGHSAGLQADCVIAPPSPPPPSPPPPGSPTCSYDGTMVNLAEGKTASASSENSGQLASMAVDGQFGTRWESAYCGDEACVHWVAVDLGAPLAVCEARVSWEGAFASRFELQASDDGAAWTTLVSVDNSASQGPHWTQTPLPVDTVTRHMRLYCTERKLHPSTSNAWRRPNHTKAERSH